METWKPFLGCFLVCLVTNSSNIINSSTTSPWWNFSSELLPPLLSRKPVRPKLSKICSPGKKRKQGLAWLKCNLFLTNYPLWVWKSTLVLSGWCDYLTNVLQLNPLSFAWTRCICHLLSEISVCLLKIIFSIIVYEMCLV